jgi:hypothetical protein
LQAIDSECEGFVPSATQLREFINFEYGVRREYLSYFRDSENSEGGAGALKALAVLRGIEVTILTGDSACLVRTLYVPPAGDKKRHYYLHHVGYRDQAGRMILNHFNRLNLKGVMHPASSSIGALISIFERSSAISEGIEGVSALSKEAVRALRLKKFG